MSHGAQDCPDNKGSSVWNVSAADGGEEETQEGGEEETQEAGAICTLTADLSRWQQKPTQPPQAMIFQYNKVSKETIPFWTHCCFSSVLNMLTAKREQVVFHRETAEESPEMLV